MKLSAESARLMDFSSRLPVSLPQLKQRHRSLLDRQYRNYARWQSVIAVTGIADCEKTEARPDYLIDNIFVDSHIHFSRPHFRSAFLCSLKFDRFEIRAHIESEKVDLSFKLFLSHLMALLCMFGEEAKTVKMFYIPTCAKKILPENGGIIGPAHINSGSTLAVGHGEIDVWRREEHTKLFLRLVARIKINFETRHDTYHLK